MDRLQSAQAVACIEALCVSYDQLNKPLADHGSVRQNIEKIKAQLTNLLSEEEDHA